MNRVRIRLSRKITAIGVVGLVGLLTFGALDQFRSWQRDNARVLEEKARSIRELSRDAYIEMLQARRAEKNFLLRREQSYIQKQERFSTAADQHLGELKSLMLANDFADLAGQIETLQSGLASYMNAFAGLQRAELELGLNESMGQSAALIAAADDILAKLKEVDDSRLSGEMSTIVRHMRDFMLQRNAGYPAEFLDAAARFKAIWHWPT